MSETEAMDMHAHVAWHGLRKGKNPMSAEGVVRVIVEERINKQVHELKEVRDMLIKCIEGYLDLHAEMNHDPCQCPRCVMARELLRQVKE